MIGSTNQPWSIDPAHKRSGRFELLIYIKAFGFWERRQYFMTRFRPIKKEHPEMFGIIDCNLLALATTGYTGADLEKIINNSYLNSMEGKKTRITTRNVQKALWSKEGGKSSLDQWAVEMYYKYLPKKKSLLKSLISKKYRDEAVEKTKFDKADLELYKELVDDVSMYMRWRWVTRIVRLIGRGFPNYA